MDSLGVFCDSIKTVVYVSCKCAETKTECPTNECDVKIVAIIAIVVFLVVLCVCWTIRSIIKMKKHEGMKSILEDIIKKERFKEKKTGENEQA